MERPRTLSSRYLLTYLLTYYYIIIRYIVKKLYSFYLLAANLWIQKELFPYDSDWFLRILRNSSPLFGETTEFGVPVIYDFNTSQIKWEIGKYHKYIGK